MDGGPEKSKVTPTDLEPSSPTVTNEFTYRYKDVRRTKQKVTELEPGTKVVWHVLDSELAFVGAKGEWTGTDIVFDISRKGGKTEVRFTHIGPVGAAGPRIGRPHIQPY